jgi:hypothetical protein
MLHKSDRCPLRIDSDFISITLRTLDSYRSMSAVNTCESAGRVAGIACRLRPDHQLYRGLIPRCGQEIYLS